MKKLSAICESTWGDMRKRAEGNSMRMEDETRFNEIVSPFISRHNLKEGDYKVNSDFSIDINQSISIKEEDLVDGKLPFKFGKIKGNFWMDGLDITTLENSPREVTRAFVIYNNKLRNFIGGPEIVGENFGANFNKSLESLDGSPKIVGGKYSILYCGNVKDISGITPEIGGNLEVTDGEKHRVWCDYSDTEYRKLSNIKGQIIRR